MNDNLPGDLLTVDELCEILSIGHNAAYSLLNQGKIKAFKIGRIWKISRLAVFDYIAKESQLQLSLLSSK